MKGKQLQEHYRQQQLYLITEKAGALHKRDRLLEALDVSDLERVQGAIEGLKSVLGDAWNGLQSLQDAVAKAQKDVLVSKSGLTGAQLKTDTLKGFVDDVGKVAGAKLATKLTNIFAFITSLTQGLKNIPTIVKTVTVAVEQTGTPGAEQSISLVDFLKREESGLEMSLAQLSKEYKLDMKAFKNAALQSLRPKGIIGFINRVLGKNTVPYLDDAQFIHELIELPIKELLMIGRRAQGMKPPVGKEEFQAAGEAAGGAGEPQNKSGTGTRNAEDIVRNLDDAAKKQLMALLQKYPPQRS